jgi:hypothetical protein
MTLQEKSLYHQIHPVKLFTDWSAGLIALYPFWRHNFVVALLIAFLPSIVVSLILIRFVNLEKQKKSSFGRYVRQYMTRSIETVRFVGFIIMAIGAWYHVVWVIVAGLMIIILTWLRGVLLPSR